MILAMPGCLSVRCTHMGDPARTNPVRWIEISCIAVSTFAALMLCAKTVDIVWPVHSDRSEHLTSIFNCSCIPLLRRFVRNVTVGRVHERIDARMGRQEYLPAFPFIANGVTSVTVAITGVQRQYRRGRRQPPGTSDVSAEAYVKTHAPNDLSCTVRNPSVRWYFG